MRRERAFVLFYKFFVCFFSKEQKIYSLCALVYDIQLHGQFSSSRSKRHLDLCHLSLCYYKKCIIGT